MLLTSKVFALGAPTTVLMDAMRERRGVEALRAYVTGDSSEPIVISAFREFPRDETEELVIRHRSELEAIDGARLTILESVLLPFAKRSR